MDFNGTWVYWEEKHFSRHWSLQESYRYEVINNVFDCNLFLLFSHVASSPEWNPGLIGLTFHFCLFTYFVFLILCAEVNDRDYRAWYGLGQTYEILKMPFYCLYYYRQAHKFRYAQFSLHSSTLSVYLTACVPHFGVFCDLLLKRRKTTWNLFALCSKKALTVTSFMRLSSPG